MLSLVRLVGARCWPPSALPLHATATGRWAALHIEVAAPPRFQLQLQGLAPPAAEPTGNGQQLEVECFSGQPRSRRAMHTGSAKRREEYGGDAPSATLCPSPRRKDRRGSVLVYDRLYERIDVLLRRVRSHHDVDRPSLTMICCPEGACSLQPED